MAMDTLLVATEVLGRCPQGERPVRGVGRSGGDHQEPDAQTLQVLRWAGMSTDQTWRRGL
jgi:hypothetical protein